MIGHTKKTNRDYSFRSIDVDPVLMIEFYPFSLSIVGVVLLVACRPTRIPQYPHSYYASGQLLPEQLI